MSEWFSSLPPRAREDVKAVAYRLQILWDHWTTIATHVETLIQDWRNVAPEQLQHETRELKLSKFLNAPEQEIKAVLHWPALDFGEGEEVPDWAEPIPDPQPAVGKVWLDPEILTGFHLPLEVIALLRWPGLQEKLVRLLRKNRLEGLKRVLPMGWLAWDEKLPPFAQSVGWLGGDWEDALDRGDVIFPKNVPRVDNRPPLILLPPPQSGFSLELKWVFDQGLWQMEDPS